MDYFFRPGAIKVNWIIAKIQRKMIQELYRYVLDKIYGNSLKFIVI
jgi:hypothetical protein